MSIISKIRNYFFENQLQQKLSQIKISRTSVEFDVAESIGILFDATDAANRNRVMEYAQNLIQQGKKDKLLAFVKTKQKDLSFSFKFFTLQEVNWKMIPEGNMIQDFMNKKFDILISLFLGKNNPLEYISSLSKSHLRVGPFSENTHAFDLMIDTPKNADLEHLIKQVNFFLTRINSPAYETAI